jgi:uncharacterized cupredoxin-like copper-binding protein
MTIRSKAGITAIAAAIGAVALMTGASVWAAPSRQDAPELGAGIFAGTCREYEESPVFVLNSPVKPKGEAVRGLPAVSRTNLETGLAGLQSDPHIILIFRDEPSSDVACGEIHSVTSEDGLTLATGLFEQNSSLYAGVAELTAADRGTIVRLFVSRALSNGYDAIGGGGDERDEPEVTTTVEVSLDEFEITLAKTEFVVGETVEFNVTNTGRKPHELMLEERDAVEEPLESKETGQAETEDIAPEGEASFIYTFEERGQFQLADHIASNYRRGMVIPIEVADADV